MADHTGEQIGNYRLIQLMGRGGFAEVYLAKHIHLDTQAAIKLLHTQLADANAIEDFKKEARIIAQLLHPHIIRTLDFGIQGTTPYLVMDYAPNGSLRQRQPKGARLPLTTILPYVRQVAEALDYAHSQKIIHRDIKPENMLVGTRGDILLSDFGIAIVAQSSQYQGTQDLAGTIAYMAPEQIQGHPRPASDQYALGIVVYEWLTGQRPFQGTLSEIAVQQSAASPPPLRQFIQVPEAVEDVLRRALAKDPMRRFPNVVSFANALEQAATGKVTLDATIAASPASAVPPTVASPTPVLNPTIAATPSSPSLTPPLPSVTTNPGVIPPPPPGPVQGYPAGAYGSGYGYPVYPPGAYPPPMMGYPAYYGYGYPPMRRQKAPALLPFLRGGFKLADLLALPLYGGALIGLMVFFVHAGSTYPTDQGAIWLSSILTTILLLLAGPFLGGWRALVVGIGAGASFLIAFQQRYPESSIPAYVYIMFLCAIAAMGLTGWLYALRKTRGFMGSWGLLSLEVALVYLGLLIPPLIATTHAYYISSTLLTLVVILVVGTPILSVILAALEALVQTIAKPMLKQKQEMPPPRMY